MGRTLKIVDQTSPYALTGAIFSKIDMLYNKHFQHYEMQLETLLCQ